MKYHFSVDRKALLGFGLGLGMLVALVFADGVFTGMGLYRHNLLPLMLAQQQRADGVVSAAGRAPGGHPSLGSPAAASATQVAASAPAPAASAPVSTAGAAPESACGVAAPSAETAADQSAFALQLGAFLDAANATRLATDLKSRGCAADVLQITDASHRVWNVVRIGPFNSMREAAQAAAEMRRTQGLLALVRPAHSI